MAMRRVRVELGEDSYEALRYFGMLRGQPVGAVMQHNLTIFADKVRSEFPAVQAHVTARRAMHQQVGMSI